MSSHFFAMMSRMKYIERWALMRNSQRENISEHSLEVSMLAHALAVISNRRLGNNLNAERAALIGIYHDSTEIITGDMPTPVKYHNQEIEKAYKQIEEMAANKLLSMIPEDLKEDYYSLFFQKDSEEYIYRLVKAADRLSALIKCIEERKAGNTEFLSAEKIIRDSVLSMKLSEVDVFFEEFLPSYEKTLDELK